MSGISWLAEKQLASQEGLCCVEWVSKQAAVIPPSLHSQWMDMLQEPGTIIKWVNEAVTFQNCIWPGLNLGKVTGHQSWGSLYTPQPRPWKYCNGYQHDLRSNTDWNLLHLEQDVTHSVKQVRKLMFTVLLTVEHLDIRMWWHQLDALFIFSLFRHCTATCFGLASWKSSRWNKVYMWQLVCVVHFSCQQAIHCYLLMMGN
jgi:hypothetical protein